LPDEGHQHSIGEHWVQRGRRGHWIAIALIVIGALILWGNLVSRHDGGGIGFAVVAIVIGALLLRRHPTPPAPPPPPTAYPWSPSPPEPENTQGDDTAPSEPLTDTEPLTDPSQSPPPPPPPPPLAPPSGGGGASWGPDTEELRPPRGRSLPAIVLSILLIGAGAVGLMHAAGWLSVSIPVFLAGALIFVGIALLVSAWTGGTGGLIAIGVVLTVALAIASVVRVPLSGGVGDKRWVPSSAEEVRTFYKHGAGNVVIDLSHVTFPPEGQAVRARLGVGHLKVVVPAEARATVSAHTGAGDLWLFGRHENGLDVDSSAATGNPDRGTVHLSLEVGAGQIEVVRAESVVSPPVPLTPFAPTPPTAPAPPTTVAAVS